ncbi:MAG: hypothetical protein R3C14_24955 [Caldilineaceae bacterium]
MNSSMYRTTAPVYLLFAGLLLTIMLTIGACGGMTAPAAPPPTPTFTPTPLPTPTPVPTPVAAAATNGAPEPIVTIPADFNPVLDKRLGYSFAVPKDWSALDLRSSQFQTMAGLFGMGDQIASLNEFLDSPEGQSLGFIYVTDLTSAMFGGLPTVLNVSVVNAPGYTAESVGALIEQTIQRNMSTLGKVAIEKLDTGVVNNLPAVQGVATADLSAIGMKNSAYAQVVGLVVNEKVYVMTLLTQAGQRGAKEPIFNQIIGTFRPEAQ